MKTFKSSVGIAFALLGIFIVSAHAQSGYVNPLTGSLSTHDPVIMKQDSVYYLFHTGNGIPIKKSMDRMHWENGSPGRVYDVAPAWHSKINSTINSWAPAISHWGGKYWLYYSISNFGQRRSGIGLFSNTTLHQEAPEYEWVDEGMVICTYDNAETHPECYHAGTESVGSLDTNAFNAIDPDIYVDSSGTPWMTWGSFGSGINMIRLNPETGKPAPGAERITVAHRYHTGAGAGYYQSIEAPVVSKRKNWYYLWYSHDRCCAGASSTYKVKVVRASSVTGPYFDREGNQAHPPYRTGTSGSGPWQAANAGLLVSEGDSIWAATGHNDIIVDNDTTFLVNHGYLRDGGQTRLMIRPLYWTENDWPTLDSTEGVATTPVSIHSISGRAVVPVPRPVDRQGGSVLVPWRNGLRDLLGRGLDGIGVPEGQ